MALKLRQRQQWLAATLKSIGDAVISTDNAGKIIFMNPAAEMLTDWNVEEGGEKGIRFKVFDHQPHEVPESLIFPDKKS